MFAIYPNPANQQVTLLFPENQQKTTLQLRDLTGKLLSETTVQRNENVLNTAEYPNGIYLLNVITETGTTTEKLVVQH